MDEERTVGGQIIQWDDEKNEINIRKHGISLKAACYVFADPHRKWWLDVQHSVSEKRYKTLGRIGKIVFAVYTERGDVIRLISARRATEKEREVYLYGNPSNDDS